MVSNLSSAALDDDNIKLLSRGLSFFPNPRQANSEAALDDLEGYFRHLRLKALFLDEDDEEEESNNAATQTQFCPRVRGCLRKVETLPSRHLSKRSGRTSNAGWKIILIKM